MEAEVSCNACGVMGKALMKLSLGKDFFGRPYDRLSPSADQSPKWYCESCSMLKNLQRDFRDIREEFERHAAGQPSAFAELAERQRGQIRLQEIVAIVEQYQGGSRLIALSDVKQLLERFHGRS